MHASDMPLPRGGAHSSRRRAPGAQRKPPSSLRDATFASCSCCPRTVPHFARLAASGCLPCVPL